jgi:hypothetical protein
MENYISAAPTWAIVLFIPSFLFSLWVIARPYKQAALNAGMTPGRSGRIQGGIIVFYILWLGYASILALKGILAANTLPPKVFVLLTIPLTLFLFAVVGNTPLFKQLLRSASLESLVGMHIFRVLGGPFFILLLAYKLLPTEFALSAGLGDFFTAILSIPVARAVAQKKPWSRKAVYAWNVFGILDIVSLMTIAILNAVKPEVAARNAGEMTMFPFVWFPAFAPATILFLHFSIFRKLRWSRSPDRLATGTPRDAAALNQNYA